MTSFTKQEYLDLIQRLVDDQYDDTIDDYNIEEMEWIPAEPEIKKKVIEANNNGLIDLTNVKSNKIKEELFKCTNLKVGLFKIRISRYQALPINNGSQICVNIEVWEEKTKTPNGMPCKMDFPLLFYKDSRFDTRPWLKYFKQGHCGFNIPIDTVVDIIRWFQAVKKLTAFL